MKEVPVTTSKCKLFGPCFILMGSCSYHTPDLLPPLPLGTRTSAEAAAWCLLQAESLPWRCYQSFILWTQNLQRSVVFRGLLLNFLLHSSQKRFPWQFL